MVEEETRVLVKEKDDYHDQVLERLERILFFVAGTFISVTTIGVLYLIFLVYAFVVAPRYR